VLGTGVATETPHAAAPEAAPAHTVAPTVGIEPTVLATTDVTIGVEDHNNSGMNDLAHHLHHTWG